GVEAHAVGRGAQLDLGQLGAEAPALVVEGVAGEPVDDPVGLDAGEPALADEVAPHRVAGPGDVAVELPEEAVEAADARARHAGGDVEAAEASEGLEVVAELAEGSGGADAPPGG